jgi:hypothetical protein
VENKSGKIMTTRTKIEISVVVAVSALLLYFFSGKEPKEPARPIKQNNNEQIDSIKAVMQLEIDSLRGRQSERKTKIIYRTKVIDSLRVIADTSCLPIIAAFDRKITEYDSLVVDMSRENVLLTNQLYQTNLQRTNDSLYLVDFGRKYDHLDSLYIQQGKKLKKRTVIGYIVCGMMGGVLIFK